MMISAAIRRWISLKVYAFKKEVRSREIEKWREAFPHNSDETLEMMVFGDTLPYPNHQTAPPRK